MPFDDNQTAKNSAENGSDSSTFAEDGKIMKPPAPPASREIKEGEYPKKPTFWTIKK